MKNKITDSDCKQRPSLSDEDTAALLQNFRPRKDAGFTKSEAAVLLDWAEQVRSSYALLELALMGAVKTSLKGKEVVFEAVDLEVLKSHANSGQEADFSQ